MGNLKLKISTLIVLGGGVGEWIERTKSKLVRGEIKLYNNKNTYTQRENSPEFLCVCVCMYVCIYLFI